METLTIVVNSKSGLHARPAAMFVGVAKNFSSEIIIQKDDIRANGKSMMGVLSIAAGRGDILEIVAKGQDELDAIGAIKHLFDTQLIHE
jgi:phosphocarrier protein